MSWHEELMAEVNANYGTVAARYQTQKNAFMQKIQDEQNISGKEFISFLQEKFQENMEQKINSPLTGNDVKIDTILQHIHKAAAASARSILGGVEANNEIEEARKKIQQIKQETGINIEKENQLINKEVDQIISDFATQIELNNIFNKYLPGILSGENQKLSEAQVMAYCKSIFKNEIQKKLSLDKVSRVINQKRAIILGYIREDAVTDAAEKAIEHFKMQSASAQTVGGAQSKIDVLISLTGQSSQIFNNKEILDSLLSNLDQIQSFSVEGDSKYDSEEFLGIQAKPWKLYMPTTNYNRNSIGSRSILFTAFSNSFGGMEGEHGWHNGVKFLSENLSSLLGENTLIYTMGNNNIVWTDDLLNSLINQYHKYFAFSIGPSYELSKHVVIADHTC